MKIITVCGSLKFYKEMMDITEKMELQGNCMLVPIYNPSKSSKDDFTEEEALMLDKMHKERIKLSDAILVVNVNDYIGSSTKSEIEFAKSLNKEIIYSYDKKIITDNSKQYFYDMQSILKLNIIFIIS